MKKVFLSLLCMLLLLSCMTRVTVFADTRASLISYSVPATVTYKDYDGSSTTQKVEVGSLLKAPEAKGKEGCSFYGWKDEKSGLFWDFSKPVTEHLTLVAAYSEPKNLPQKSQKKDGIASLLQKAGGVKTGEDFSSIVFEMIILAAGVALLLVLFGKKETDRSK